MIPLLADENVNRHIVDGLTRCDPDLDLDLVHVREVGLEAAPDPEILEWAARHDRALLTHDRRTIPPFAYARVAAGRRMPGVFLVSDDMPTGQAIDEILVAVHCLTADVEGRFHRLFAEFVTRHDKPTDRPLRRESQIWSDFERLARQRHLEASLRPFTVSSDVYPYEFHGSFQNGKPNVIEPISLDLLGGSSIVEKANHWAGRLVALKRFLVEEGAGSDHRFWKLAQSLSALDPMRTEEKRWVDGVLARKKGLGF